MAAPAYSDGPSKPIAAPNPSVLALATSRPITGRTGRRSFTWKFRTYSSEVAGVARAARNRRASAAPARPTSGPIAWNHNGASRRWSSMPVPTTRSNNATARPVRTPVTTANATTRRFTRPVGSRGDRDGNAQWQHSRELGHAVVAHAHTAVGDVLAEYRLVVVAVDADFRVTAAERLEHVGVPRQ